MFGQKVSQADYALSDVAVHVDNGVQRQFSSGQLPVEILVELFLVLNLR